MQFMIWVLESTVFPANPEKLREAIASSGQRIVDWQDEWWSDGPPHLAESPVVFHGSLENAARVRSSLAWRPSAFCNVSAFHCTAWYPATGEWLLNQAWRCLSAAELVADRDRVFSEIGDPEAIFVRLDSPLKPFAGRTLSRDRINLAALDYGFYYDDATLPVIVAPVRKVDREWRYVIANRDVIAGCACTAFGRAAIYDDPRGSPWQFAGRIAQSMPPPDEVYVLDVCECDGDLRLLELNPFSGADLYECDSQCIVDAVSRIAGTRTTTSTTE
jgi:hypothetical protein